MVIDLAKYDRQKSFALLYFRSRHGVKDIKRGISMCAHIYVVPAIAAAYWIGEETNWHPDAVSSIKRLTEFYDYKEILGKPPGAPL
jgi:hypothetical protein